MAIVHGFTKYDVNKDETIPSKFKMTAEGLAADKGLRIIPDSAENVPDDKVDGNGRYDPHA